MNISTHDLLQLLAEHAKWLADPSTGCRANLNDADLSRADLSRASLSRADLSYAKLSGADLRGADLRDADLSYAKLSYAKLSGASLSYAKLSGASLNDADMSGASLRGADLSRASLRGASLNDADLSGADLSGASLNDADLSNVRHNENTAYFAMQCPETGAFEAWKKCRDGVLVKLLIPADANRSSATSRKCRASHAEVLEVVGAEFGISMHCESVEYHVGAVVSADNWDDDRWIECSGGIHFFLTREEAEQWTG